MDEAGAGGTEESFLDSEVSIEVRPRCFPDDLQDEIEFLGAEGVDMIQMLHRMKKCTKMARLLMER